MKFRISSEFGAVEEIRNGSAHNGIDFAMPEGTTLRSVADGVVERVVDYGNYNLGKGVIIKLEDGTRTIYGHLKTIDVRVGERVAAGDVIGLSGNTGHSTGPHLHFSIMKDGEFIDPTPLADVVSEISGEVTRESIFKSTSPLGDIVVRSVKERVAESAKDKAKDLTAEIALGILEGLRDILVDLTFSIALTGGGICLILKVAGLDKGHKYAGILLVSHILIKFLLGGY